METKHDLQEPTPPRFVRTITDGPIGIEPPRNLLNAALIKAQGEFPVIEKGKSTAYKNVKFAWADLGAIRAVINPILSSNGLGQMQNVKTGKAEVSVQTTLIHSSGQERKSDWLTLQCSTDPKQIGGNITYACRYQLVAFLAIPVQGEDDIDQSNKPHQPPPRQPDKPPSAHLMDAIEASKGVWAMPDCQRYFKHKYDTNWPPTDIGQWRQIVAVVKSGVDPREVIK
jgi:hypothetical protein